MTIEPAFTTKMQTYALIVEIKVFKDTIFIAI
jgi:hypothetical protein